MTARRDAPAWSILEADASFATPEGIPRTVELPGPLPPLRPIEGRPVLWAQTRYGRERVCARADDGALRFALAVGDWLEDCRNLAGRQPRQPFYTRIPGFNVNRVPPALRRAIFERFFNASPGEPCDLLRASGIQVLSALLPASEELSRFAPPAWPEGRRAALVFTLDVDSPHIFSLDRNPMRELLERFGFRAAWFFLTGSYALDHAYVEDLRAGRHEIGWHGHCHDHRLGFARREERLRRIRHALPFFERYGVRGMRTPNFLWSDALLADVKDFLRYDTSIHDCFPWSDAGCGSSTSIPFGMRNGLWQLPTSVTEDVSFPSSVPLAARLERIRAQIDAQIRLGGVVHVLLHPEPTLSLAARHFELDRAVLEGLFARRDELWHALPGELYAHVRARAGGPPGDGVYTRSASPVC